MLYWKYQFDNLMYLQGLYESDDFVEKPIQSLDPYS